MTHFARPRPLFLVGPEILTLLECVHAAFANLADKYKLSKKQLWNLFQVGQTFPKYENAMVSDRIPSTTPGAEPPRDARDSGSARSHSMHLETSSSDRP